MRLASIGGLPIPHQLAENVVFKSDTTLLDFDILLWNPSLLITEYAPMLVKMKMDRYLFLKQSLITLLVI